MGTRNAAAPKPLREDGGIAAGQRIGPEPGSDGRFLVGVDQVADGGTRQIQGGRAAGHRQAGCRGRWWRRAVQVQAKPPEQPEVDVKCLGSFPPVEEVFADGIDRLQAAPVETAGTRAEPALGGGDPQRPAGQMPAVEAGVAVDRVTFGHGALSSVRLDAGTVPRRKAYPVLLGAGSATLRSGGGRHRLPR
jgi:hypothetical protein